MEWQKFPANKTKQRIRAAVSGYTHAQNNTESEKHSSKLKFNARKIQTVQHQD